MYGNISCYVFDDPKIRKAYMAGFMQAMQVNKLPVAFAQDRTRFENWVISKVQAYDLDIQRRYEADLRKVLDENFDKMAFRAFILDTARVDIYGRELDEDGAVISDCCGRMKPGYIHREWPKYEWVCDHDGEHYSNSAVTLEAARREGYRRVRHLDILDADGYMVLQIKSDDMDLIPLILYYDLANLDMPMILRYLQEIRSSDGRLHYQIRPQAFQNALNKLAAKLAKGSEAFTQLWLREQKIATSQQIKAEAAEVTASALVKSVSPCDDDIGLIDLEMFDAMLLDDEGDPNQDLPSQKLRDALWLNDNEFYVDPNDPPAAHLRMIRDRLQDFLTKKVPCYDWEVHECLIWMMEFKLEQCRGIEDHASHLAMLANDEAPRFWEIQTRMQQLWQLEFKTIDAKYFPPLVGIKAEAETEAD